MPRFVLQRTLYEARERSSRMYSWLVFVISNIVVEIPYQAFLGIVAFASYHYAVFGIQSSQRQGLMLLFFIQNFIFASTFAQMIVSGLPNAEGAGSLATIFLFMCSMFNGVMQPPSALPGFWIFMYRVDPLSYLVGGITSTGLHGRNLTCTPEELSEFDPPAGKTCGEYLASYLQKAPGRLFNPDASASCQYCPLRTADQFLAGNKVYWSDRWRNFGILFAFIIFNILATIGLYWLARVRPLRRKGDDKPSKEKKAFSARLALFARMFFVRDPAEDKKGREARVEKIY
jgi:ATP-binding cassette, subfamily G (WHITE), member 2, PDR